MKSLCKVVCVSTVLCLVVSSVRADFNNPGNFTTPTWQVKLSVVPNMPNNGGPFWAEIQVSKGDPAWIGPTTSFYTFCIEEGEYFIPGQTYNVQVDTSAWLGNAKQVPNRLLPETAYLYEQFLLNPDLKTGGDYQEAIWYLQGQRSWNALTTNAQGLVSKANEHQTDPSTALVKVMNLWWSPNDITGGWGKDDTTHNVYQYQSQLAIVPVLPGTTTVPAPAAIVIGALGLGLVGWSKKRLVKDD